MYGTNVLTTNRQSRVLACWALLVSCRTRTPVASGRPYAVIVARATGSRSRSADSTTKPGFSHNACDDDDARFRSFDHTPRVRAWFDKLQATRNRKTTTNVHSVELTETLLTPKIPASFGGFCQHLRPSHHTNEEPIKADLRTVST